MSSPSFTTYQNTFVKPATVFSTYMQVTSYLDIVMLIILQEYGIDITEQLNYKCVCFMQSPEQLIPMS